MIPQIWAELSGCHGGKLENCLRLIDGAKALGVDRVKFQRFNAYQLAAKRKTNPAVLEAINHYPDPLPYLAELYQEINTPLEWWPYIKDRLGEQRWACSVFSEEDALHMRYVHDCQVMKVASFELTDIPLIKRIAKLKTPIVISVNHHATQSDVSRAYDAAQGCRTITFLHATKYKGGRTDDELFTEVRRFEWLLETVPPPHDVGLSDHSPPNFNNLAMMCAQLGASMIERHLCLPDIHTPDSEFSSTPEQFSEYIHDVRMVAEGVKNERRRVGT